MGGRGNNGLRKKQAAIGGEYIIASRELQKEVSSHVLREWRERSSSPNLRVLWTQRDLDLSSQQGQHCTQPHPHSSFWSGDIFGGHNHGGHIVGVSEIRTSYNLWDSAEKKESSCIPHDFSNVLSDMHVGRVRFAVKMTKLRLQGLLTHM